MDSIQNVPLVAPAGAFLRSYWLIKKVGGLLLADTQFLAHISAVTTQ